MRRKETSAEVHPPASVKNKKSSMNMTQTVQSAMGRNNNNDFSIGFGFLTELPQTADMRVRTHSEQPNWVSRSQTKSKINDSVDEHNRLKNRSERISAAQERQFFDRIL